MITITVSQSMLKKNPFSFQERQDGGCWLELQIDIEDGEVQCGIAVGAKPVFPLECGANSEKEFEKENRLRTKLPNIEFNAGIVPIVITNHMEAVVGAAGSLEWRHSQLLRLQQPTAPWDSRSDSRTGKVEEVKEGNLNSDGLSGVRLR